EKPRDAGCADAVGEGDSVEEDPAGLGVEAAGGDLRRAGVSDEDERGDADGVEQKDSDDTDGDQEVRAREAEFAAEEPEQAERKGEDEADAFEAGAFGCDLDVEVRRAEDASGGIGDDAGD